MSEGGGKEWIEGGRGRERGGREEGVRRKGEGCERMREEVRYWNEYLPLPTEYN